MTLRPGRRRLIALGLFAVLAPLPATTKIPVKDLPERVSAALRERFAPALPVSVERGDERNDYVYFVVVLQTGLDARTRRRVTLTEFGDVVPEPPTR